MSTIIIRTVGGDTFTFSKPKRHGMVEEKNGKRVYVVEEDDGISVVKHEFVPQNIVCVTEKKPIHE